MLIKDPENLERTIRCNKKAACDKGCDKLCEDHARELMHQHWPGSASFSGNPPQELEEGELWESPIVQWNKDVNEFKFQQLCRDPYAFDVGDWDFILNEPYHRAINNQSYPIEWRRDRSNNDIKIYNMTRGDERRDQHVHISATDFMSEEKHIQNIISVTPEMWATLRRMSPLLNEMHNAGNPTMQAYPPDLPHLTLILLTEYYESLNPRTNVSEKVWSTHPPWMWLWLQRSLSVLRCEDGELHNFANRKVKEFYSQRSTWVVLISSDRKKHYFTDRSNWIVECSELNSMVEDLKAQNADSESYYLQLRIPNKTLYPMIGISEGVSRAMIPLMPVDVINLLREWYSFQPSQALWEALVHHLVNYLHSRPEHELYELTPFWAKTIDLPNDVLVPTVTKIQHIAEDKLPAEPKNTVYKYFPNFIRSIREIQRYNPRDYKAHALPREEQKQGKPKHFLGKGSFGDVYLYKEKRSDDLVAIKFLRNDPNLHVYLLREMNILILICGHSNVLKMVDVKSDDDYIYLVTLYRPHGALNEELSRQARGENAYFSIDNIKSVLLNISRGIKWSHLHGVIHADLKPENTLYIPRYNGEIIDFGSSKITYADKAVRFHGNIVTVYYRAPELFEGTRYYNGQLTKKIDIWALGIMLLEMVSKENKNPFSIDREERRRFLERNNALNTQLKKARTNHDRLQIWETVWTEMTKEKLDIFLTNGVLSKAKLERYLQDHIRDRRWITPNLLNLLQGVLDTNPDRRLTIDQVLRHPWFGEHLQRQREQREVIDNRGCVTPPLLPPPEIEAKTPIVRSEPYNVDRYQSNLIKAKPPKAKPPKAKPPKAKPPKAKPQRAKAKAKKKRKPSPPKDVKIMVKPPQKKKAKKAYSGVFIYWADYKSWFYATIDYDDETEQYRPRYTVYYIDISGALQKQSEDSEDNGAIHEDNLPTHVRDLRNPQNYEFAHVHELLDPAALPADFPTGDSRNLELYLDFLKKSRSKKK
jgi:serine/threonine protein kinase